MRQIGSHNSAKSSFEISFAPYLIHPLLTQAIFLLFRPKRINRDHLLYVMDSDFMSADWNHVYIHWTTITDPINMSSTDVGRQPHFLRAEIEALNDLTISLCPSLQ